MIDAPEMLCSNWSYGPPAKFFGYAYICLDGRSPYYRMLGVDKDDFIPKYQKLVKHVHRNGAKIAMQITHCGRQTTQKIYERCRDNVGTEYPILIKMNAYDKMKNGLKLEESILMAKMMEDMGFDGIEVSGGIDEDGGAVLMGDAPWGAKPVQAYNRQSAKAIKYNLSIPVFVVGGITDPAAMADIVENGDADYISLCRALISDPKFPEKIQKGSREPARCIHCLLCAEYLPFYPLHCYHGKRIPQGGV